VLNLIKNIYIKIFVILSIEFLIIIFSVPLAYIIRTDSLRLFYLNLDFALYSLLILSHLFFLLYNEVLKDSIRFINRHLILQIIKINFYVFLIFILYNFFIGKELSVPRSIPLIYLFIATSAGITYRFLISQIFELINNQQNKIKNVIIYGAGRKGVALSRYLLQSENKKTSFFIDDDTKLQRSKINGIKIISSKKLKKIVGINNTEIYISVNKNNKNFPNILYDLKNFSKNINILTSQNDELENKFRKLELNDFFKRSEIKAIPINNSKIRNKKILVTGAGGSIGSKLSEQLALEDPNEIHLLEFHEFSLVKVYKNLLEIKEKNSLNINIKYILLNIANVKKLDKIMKFENYDYIFHCAAYKHVDISENAGSLEEYYYNNYINTKNLIILSLKNRIDHFVLVSTDKAVQPSNIMGLTKRLCEIYLLEICRRFKLKNYKIVRFGNVFRSSGSVVPIIEDQIKKGGPVTITHPDVERYFMSISEAVLLILQALEIENSNLLILEMGEQIKILEIANLLIKLNQKEGKNIKIKITGLRKGEKISEELSYDKLIPTSNKMIFTSKESVDPGKLFKLKKLEKEFKKINYNKKLIEIKNICSIT